MAGVFNNNHFWLVQWEYAKEDPTSLSCCCTVSNCSQEDVEIWLLPQFWFRSVPLSSVRVGLWSVITDMLMWCSISANSDMFIGVVSHCKL